MRHGIAGNKLNRKTAHRKATVRDIAKATLIRERICTTKAKAKEARKLVDKLITLGKKGTLAHKRQAFAILCDHKLVSTLFNETAVRFKKRAGGYTRIIPLGNRQGDNAELAFLELTEKKEVIISQPKGGIVSGKEKSAKSSEDEAQEQKPTQAAKPKTSKDTVKHETKKEQATKVKTQKSKKILGGIRKIMNKKSGDK